MIHFDMNIEDFGGKTGFNQERDSMYRLLNLEIMYQSQVEFVKNKQFNKWRVTFDNNAYNPISKIDLCKTPFSRTKN